MAEVAFEFLCLTDLICKDYNTFEKSVLTLSVKAADPHLPSNAEAVVLTLHFIP